MCQQLPRSGFILIVVGPSSASQVDFVGYVVNSFFRRGAAHGEAAAALSLVRNRRQARRSERPSSAEGGLAALAAARRERVGRRVPKGYRYVEIKASAAKVKFEEFDFSYYNRTRFAGLENDMANSYCNALLQVWKPNREVANGAASRTDSEFGVGDPP